jgi:hypothetical protein
MMRHPIQLTRMLAVLAMQGVLVQADPLEQTPFSDWFWRVRAGSSVLHMNDEGDPYRFGAGRGHSFAGGRFSLMGDLVYSYYDVNAVADEHKDENVKGGRSTSLGFDLNLRCNVLEKRAATGFFEGGIGFQSMLTSPTFPADGSYQNFTLFAGPGIQFPIGTRTRLAISLQWFHISNAWLFSSNSGYDGIQLVLAPEWDW